MFAIMLDLQFNTSTVVALITLAGTLFTAIVALASAVWASQANKAVNNRGTGEPIIYDMVKETRDKVVVMENWKHDYEGGSLDTGEKVEKFVSKVDKIAERCGDVNDKLEDIKKDVRKYGCPVKLGERNDCANQ
jgi:hypothetical protein